MLGLRLGMIGIIHSLSQTVRHINCVLPFATGYEINMNNDIADADKMIFQ